MTNERLALASISTNPAMLKDGKPPRLLASFRQSGKQEVTVAVADGWSVKIERLSDDE